MFYLCGNLKKNSKMKNFSFTLFYIKFLNDKESDCSGVLLFLPLLICSESGKRKSLISFFYEKEKGVKKINLSLFTKTVYKHGKL